MANLTLVTPIPPQVICKGEVFAVSMHVHDDGANFNWTTAGFTPVGKITVGTITITGSGSVINAAGGTATVAWTAAQTLTVDANSWGTIVIYADPTSGSENRHIATIFARITAESIP
jgi:hypothetical protein